jgi:hypothetical protein
MWNLSTIPLPTSSLPIHSTRFGEDPPPAPHIKSSGPNNQAITNPRLTMLKRTKGIEEEISLIKKEKSKPRHTLGIKHGNIPTQLDLWGNGVIFRGKGQTTLHGYPRLS